ncbi:unannotated protein [freshwater metagenome]|uniref:Unannotated protein n=1 Tax=freshwater metagenome TaxID=449393 RepID=A0A6J7E0C8_9ZZZZ
MHRSIDHLEHLNREGDRPLGPGDSDELRVAKPLRVGLRKPGHDRAGRCGQEWLAILHDARVEKGTPRDDRKLAGRPAAQRRFDGRRDIASASPGAKGTELAPNRGHIGGPDTDLHGRRDHAQNRRIALGERVAQDLAERTRPPFPIEEASGLLGDDGHREHDVGACGDLRVVVLQGHDEAHALNRAQGEVAVWVVGQFDAAGDERGDLSCARCLEQALPVQSASRRQCVGLNAPRSRHLLTGLGIIEGSSAGKKPSERSCIERTPLPRPSRDPGECRTGRCRQGRHGGGATGNTGNALAHEDHGTGQAQRCGDVGRKACQRACFGAGGGFDELAAHLGQARGSDRADAHDTGTATAGRLAQSQEHDRGFVLSLERNHENDRCLLEGLVRSGDPRPRNDGPEEVSLLG